MFGKKIDYLLLRLFVHSRNKANEEELDIQLNLTSSIDINRARNQLKKIRGYFGNQIPIDPGKTYLDVGCGNGELDIALVEAGITRLTGVDWIDQYIGKARKYTAETEYNNKLTFIHANILEWEPENLFDVVFSHDALEHIPDPAKFIGRLFHLVKPSGIVLLGFGPLFYSPFGDHCNGFFRVPIPWRGILFSEKAILKLRQQYFRPSEIAQHFEDIKGGLNKMRYTEFSRYIHESGYKIRYWEINPPLRKYPLIHTLFNALGKITVLQDYFAGYVYVILQRPSGNHDDF